MRQLNTLDQVIAGAAAVAFITLFLPWYTATIGNVSVSGSGGLTGSVGAVLLTAAGVLLVRRRVGGSLRSGANAGPSAFVAGLAALGQLLVIVRWANLPRDHAGGVDFSYRVEPRYGLYVALIAGIVETAAVLLAMRAAGERDSSDEPAPGPDAPAGPDE